MPICASKPTGPWPSSPSDNPPQNGVNERMTAEFLVALDKVEAGVLGGLLPATNGPDFSVGGDITNSPEISNRQLRATFEQYMSVFIRLGRLPLPLWWRQRRARASAVGRSSPSGRPPAPPAAVRGR